MVRVLCRSVRQFRTDWVRSCPRCSRWSSQSSRRQSSSLTTKCEEKPIISSLLDGNNSNLDIVHLEVHSEVHSVDSDPPFCCTCTHTCTRITLAPADQTRYLLLVLDKVFWNCFDQCVIMTARPHPHPHCHWSPMWPVPVKGCLPDRCQLDPGLPHLLPLLLPSPVPPPLLSQLRSGLCFRFASTPTVPAVPRVRADCLLVLPNSFHRSETIAYCMDQLDELERLLPAEWERDGIQYSTRSKV